MTSIEARLGDQGIELVTAAPVHLPLGSGIRDVAASPGEAAAFQALDELWQDGQVDELAPGSWLVPFDRLLHVGADSARALDLPQPDEALQTELRSTGLLTKADFSIRLEVRHPQHGRLDPSSRRGPAFVLPGSVCILMPADTWRLAACVAAAPEASAGTESRAEYLGRCVEAARKAGAGLDGFLEANTYEVIDDLRLEIAEGDEEIQLGVSGEGLGNDDLLSSNGRALPFPRKTGPDGRRQRVIVSKGAREKAEKVAQRSTLRGAEIPEFLGNPEAFVPEGMDLSDFSERVRGFRTRVYNSRPYLHVDKEPRGWLDFDAGISLTPTIGEGEGNQIPVGDYRRIVEEAEETGERFVKHGDDWVEVDTEQAHQFLHTLDRIEELRSQERAFSTRVLLDVIPNVDILEFEVELPESMRPERPWVELLPEIHPPASFVATLDQHQLLGFRWLSYLHDLGAGGLLADEMGVGKTAQVIALLAKLKEERRLFPSLLVLPKTLIPNWKEELARFAPGIRPILEHTGSQRTSSGEYLAGMDLVITTYDTARQDQIMLGAINWKVVVADEAQFVKNPTAARTSVVKALKTDQALALTGTPVENGLIEFWCIMDYVQPGLLKSWSDFRSQFERPLIQAADEASREQIVEELLSQLDPHYLRRLKEEVLKALPDKIVQEPIRVPLGPLQEQRYRAILGDARERGSEVILGAITRLLMTCSHPRASLTDWEDQTGESLIEECPKLEQTMGILEKVQAAGEKALVFTTWKATQKILRRAIWSRFGCSAEIVNGDLTTRRQAVIDQFRAEKGFGVLILAPEVAGYGLNLIEANHIIHYTRPWNPAKENQATDRAHRRGQTKPVTVYYPTVAGTVEDKLAKLLADKAALARDVLRPTGDRIVTAEDLVGDLDLDNGDEV